MKGQNTTTLETRLMALWTDYEYTKWAILGSHAWQTYPHPLATGGSCGLCLWRPPLLRAHERSQCELTMWAQGVADPEGWIWESEGAELVIQEEPRALRVLDVPGRRAAIDMCYSK